MEHDPSSEMSPTIHEGPMTAQVGGFLSGYSSCFNTRRPSHSMIRLEMPLHSSHCALGLGIQVNQVSEHGPADRRVETWASTRRVLAINGAMPAL